MMRIPIYRADKTPGLRGGSNKASGGGVFHRGGEERRPLTVPTMTIPKTKELEYKGVMDLSNAMVNISERMLEAERQETASIAMLELAKGFEDIHNGIETDKEMYGKTTKEHEDLFDEKALQLKDSVIEGVVDRKVRNYIETEYGKDYVRYRTKVRNIGWKRQVDRGRKRTYEELNDYSNVIIQSDNEGDIEANLSKAISSLEGALTAGYFSEVETEKIRQDFRTKSVTGYWERKLDQDALNLYPLIKDPKSEPLSFADIPESVEDAIRAYGQRKYNQALSDKKTQVIGNTLELAKRNPKAAWEEVKESTPREWSKWLDEQQIFQLRKNVETIYKADMTEKKIELIGTLYSESDDYPEETWKSFKEQKPPGWELLDAREKQQAKKYLMMNADKATGGAGDISIVDRKRLERKIDDALVSAEYTGVVDTTVEDVIDQVYSGRGKKNNETAKALKEEYRDKANERAMGFNARKQIRTMPMYNINTFIESLSPENSDKDDTTAEIEYKSAIQEAQRKITAMGQDPFTYIQNVFNYETVEENIQKQKDQGLLDFQIGAMPKSSAETIVGQLNSAKGDELVGLMQSLEEQYGDQWQYALNDLARNGLDRSYQLLVMLDRPGQAQIRQITGEALKMKDNDLKAGYGDEAKELVKAARSVIDNGMEDFVQSVYAGGMSKVRQETILSIKEGIYKTAMLMGLRNGKSPDEVAEDIVDKVINERYNYVDNVRIPSQYNHKSINTYMKFTIRNVRDYAESIKIPGSMMEIPEEEAKLFYLDHLKNNGFFVTNEDSSGLILMDEIGNPVKLVDEDGVIRQFRVPFEDAENKGKSMSDPKEFRQWQR